MSSLQQLFLKTCALLAQYYSRPDVEDGHLATPYFKMSQLSLQQVLQMFTHEDDAMTTDPAPSLDVDGLDEDNIPVVVPPGPGLISYLNRVLFGAEKPLDFDVDEKLCNRILDIYREVAPSKLSQLILLSTLKDSLSPAKAMESLQKLNLLAGYKQSTTDILTSVWLYIQLGDLEQANSVLGMLNIDEISQLLADHPELLYQQDKCELTFLAQLIRQQEPESLFEAMLQLLDQQELTLSTCAKLLQTDDHQPAHSNSHQRQFLELVLAQKHRHEVSKEATAQLASIYIERLKLWKPSALPVHQSSRRHRHVPRGSGCYATRLSWLDSLPPFTGTSPLSQRCLRTTVVPTPRLQSASMLGLLQVSSRKIDDEVDCPCCCCNEDLIKLQSLLSSNCCDVSVVKQVLQSASESQFRGSSSLNILCLNKVNPSVALGLLVDNHMGVVLDYAMTTFNGDAWSWTRLLQLVLMVAKETWTNGKKEEHPVLLETLKGILEYTSNHLEPQDFIQSLPNDGILSFFTPYLEQSCRRHKVKLLQSQALTMVTTDDATS
ncbi:BLOC-2 complex member HPS3-like [Amphiura filiformis]|uniref:BLOC-2 complex member HPS3-like n=1 Tax=Amphiura filiformis TaxID=82378 RepID=UPI003B2192DC